MVRQEPYGNGLIRSYSDNGKRLIQVETGIVYDTAIDIPNKFTYIESDENLPVEEEHENV